MKIAFLSRYQQTIERGGETFVRELSERLKGEHQVEVLSGKEADSFSKIANGKYDIVLALNGRMQAFKASLARFVAHHKLVIAGESGIGRDDLWNILVVRPNCFVALTERMKNWAKQFNLGVRVVKIPNGVDLQTFSPNGSKIEFDLPGKIILSVGALTLHKHHEKVIKALSLLEDCSLVIIGKGERHQYLQELGQLLLPGRFKIISLPYTDLPKAYRGADLFTLASWDREAFGIVYIEALASNLPIIAPDDDSRKEIVGEGGVLTNVDDPESFAKTIKEGLSRHWGNLPRFQAEKFSWDKVAESYDKLFKSL